MRPSAEIIEALGWSLLHFLWQGTAVALLLWVVLVVTRKCAAHVRYAAAGVAFLGMLGALAVTLVALWPASPMAVLDRAYESNRSYVSYEITVPPALDLPISQPPPAMTPAAPVIPEPGAATVRERVRRGLPWFVGLWALGVLVFSLRFIHAWVAVRKWRASGQPVLTGGWPERFSKLCARLQVSRPVKLLTSTAVAVPVVIGWLKPVILLPAGLLTGLTVAQLEAVLAHELAHIRRHDYLVNLLQNIVETFCFYHPAVWWVSRQLRKEREHCCDDIAASLTGGPLDYARALATLEEMRGSLNLGLSAATGPLLQRIRRIIGIPEEQSRLWPLGLMAVVALAAAVPWALAKEEGRPAPLENDSNKGRETLPLPDESPILVTDQLGQWELDDAVTLNRSTDEKWHDHLTLTWPAKHETPVMKWDLDMTLPMRKGFDGPQKPWLVVKEIGASRIWLARAVDISKPGQKPLLVAERICRVDFTNPKSITEAIWDTVPWGKDAPPLDCLAEIKDRMGISAGSDRGFFTRQWARPVADIGGSADTLHSLIISSMSNVFKSSEFAQFIANRKAEFSRTGKLPNIRIEYPEYAQGYCDRALLILEEAGLAPKGSWTRPLGLSGAFHSRSGVGNHTLSPGVELHVIQTLNGADKTGMAWLSWDYPIGGVGETKADIGLLSEIEPNGIKNPLAPKFIWSNGDMKLWIVELECLRKVDFSKTGIAKVDEWNWDAAESELSVASREERGLIQHARGEMINAKKEGRPAPPGTAKTDSSPKDQIMQIKQEEHDLELRKYELEATKANLGQKIGEIRGRIKSLEALDEKAPSQDELPNLARIEQLRAGVQDLEAELNAAPLADEASREFERRLKQLQEKKATLEKSEKPSSHQEEIEWLEDRVERARQILDHSSSGAKTSLEAARADFNQLRIEYAEKIQPKVTELRRDLVKLNADGSVAYSEDDDPRTKAIPVQLIELKQRLSKFRGGHESGLLRINVAHGASREQYVAFALALSDAGYRIKITHLSPLVFRLVAPLATETTEALPCLAEKDGVLKWLRVERASLLDFTDVKSAMARPSPDDATKWEIAIELTEDGAKKMTKVSQENRGKVLAVVSDGVVLMAPTIMSDLGAQITVSGNFSEAEAKRITAGITKGRETIPLLERGAGLPPPSPSTAEPAKSNEPSAEAGGLQAQATTAAQAKASPADTYLKAYLQREEGLKLAAAKDINGAVEKLRAAQLGFTQVQQMFPEWQSEIVAYRVKRIREEITSIEQGDFPALSDTHKQIEKFKAEGLQLREEKAILDRRATPSSKSPAIEQLLDRMNLAGRILQHEKAAEKHKLSTKEMVDAAQREFEQLVIEYAEKVVPKAADLRRNMVRLEADGTVKYYEDDDPRTMPVTVRGSGLMEKLSRARSASQLGILRINVAFGVSRVDYVAFALALHAAGYSIKLKHLSPLEFRLVSAKPTPTSETLAGAIEKDGDVTWLQVEREALLDFKSIKSAIARTSPDDATKWEIAIELTEDGAKKMTKVSQANRGKALAIVSDGVVLMAPTIMSDMGAQITVSGNFSEADAKRIAGGIPKGSETFTLLEPPPIGDEVAQARASTAKIEARLEAWRKALEELKVQKAALESLPVNPTPKGETQGNEAGLQLINRKIALFEQTIRAASEKGRMEIEAARQRMGRVLLAAARKTPAKQDACMPAVYVDKAGNLSYSVTDEYHTPRVPIKLSELPGKLREQGKMTAMTVVRVRAAPGASEDALGALLVTLKEGGLQWFSITTFAPLEFRLVGEASNTTEFLPGPKGKPDAPAGPWLSVEREALLDFKDVKSATAKSLEGDATKWEIAIELTEDGAKTMTKVSQENRGKVLAVVSDGVVLMAPTIMSDMGAQITVSGNFSEADAKRIAGGITKEMGRPAPQDDKSNMERERLPLLERDEGLEPANPTAPKSTKSNDASAKAGGLKAPATPEASIANPEDIMVTKQEVVKVTKLAFNKADLNGADLAGDVFLELFDLNEPFFWRGDMKVDPLRNAAERPLIFGLVGTFTDPQWSDRSLNSAKEAEKGGLEGPQ